MSQKLNSEVAVIGIDIGKNSFHLVGQDLSCVLETKRASSKSEKISWRELAQQC